MFSGTLLTFLILCEVWQGAWFKIIRVVRHALPWKCLLPLSICFHINHEHSSISYFNLTVTGKSKRALFFSLSISPLSRWEVIVNDMNRNTRNDKCVVIYGASDKANRFRSDSNTLKRTQKDTGAQVTNIFLFSLLTLPIQRWGSLWNCKIS